MTPRDLATHMMKWFPVHHHNRSEVLVATLCRFGRGCEWKDGEIVLKSMEVRNPPFKRMPLSEEAGRMLERFRELYPMTPDDHPVKAEMREMIEETDLHNAIVARMEQDLEPFLDADLDPSGVRYVGQIAEHSPIAAIPDDVTDEWLDACEGVARLVAEIPEGNPGDHSATNYQGNIARALAALDRVAEIRAARSPSP